MFYIFQNDTFVQSDFRAVYSLICKHAPRDLWLPSLHELMKCWRSGPFVVGNAAIIYTCEE